MSTCPTCNAGDGQPCVTKTGAVAKSAHKNRPDDLVPTSAGTIHKGVVTAVRFDSHETQKQRFDRVVAQNRAARENERKRKTGLPKINGQYKDPDAFTDLQGRADRRRMGRTNTAGRGRKFRQNIHRLNEEHRHEFPYALVSAPVSADA